MTDQNWAKLTPEEKRKRRLDAWLNPQIKFVSQEAEKAYKTRAQRLIDVYNINQPDRVPVSLPVGNLPLTLYGNTMRTGMYDYA